MNIGERIINLRNSFGMTRVQLAEKLGLPMTTLRNYEIGTREPGHKFILDVAHLFNVTTDYLLGMSDDPRPSSTTENNALSKSEIEKIKKYRALDVHGKELVDMIINKEMERVKATVQKGASVQVVPFRISEQPAAAGTGTYLGPDAFRTVHVKPDALPKGSSFGVPVSGNSMEPKYHNGDVLIVSEQHPEVGEIGVFILDGAGYVKIRGETELISINKDYAPIPMNDSIRSCGKVVGTIRKDDLV